MNAPFYLTAAVAIVATTRVITATNAVHALLYFIVSLLATALIFFLLGAPFVAALEVIVYAGAIMVLFVFVVMLLGLGREAAGQERRWLAPRAWWGPGALTLVLATELLLALLAGRYPATAARVVPPREVGLTLMGPYLLGVEMVAMLLLAALVGGYHLARRERIEAETRG